MNNKEINNGKISCVSLVDLFQCKEANITLFQYDKSLHYISIDSNAKTDKELHTQVFKELNVITQKLHEIGCDYSIGTNGDILLNCNENYGSCENCRVINNNIQ